MHIDEKPKYQSGYSYGESLTVNEKLPVSNIHPGYRLKRILPMLWETLSTKEKLYRLLAEQRYKRHRRLGLPTGYCEKVNPTINSE